MIYPDWPIFAKLISNPLLSYAKAYKKAPEGTRKDIDRCFGVLQSRFEIIRRENRRWEKEEVLIVSEVCVILHNLHMKMGEKGAFNEDGEGSDILMELQEEVNEKIGQRTLEVNASRIANRAYVADKVEAEAEAERIMIRDFSFYLSILLLKPPK